MRDTIRKQIDKMEAQWILLSAAKDRNESEIGQLERNLAWAYKEVGYVEKNRSAAVNPRVAETTLSPATGPVPPWLAAMRGITGTQWSSGAPPPAILEWQRLITTKYPDTANYLAQIGQNYISWSALAVAYCMAAAGIKPPFDAQNQTKSFLWAAAWLDFGTPVDTPELGDVLLFDFGGGSRHLALFDGFASDGNYISRGGNQSNQVKAAIFPKSSVIAIRRPPRSQD
jgi:hypothetical protein